MRQIKVGRCHNTLAFTTQRYGDFITVLEFENHALDVKKNVNNVFLNTVNLAVFVNNTGNLSFSRSKADHGAEKNTAKRVAKRMGVTGFKRFHRYGGGIRIAVNSFDFDAARLKQSINRH